MNEIEVRPDTKLIVPGTGETFQLAEPEQAAAAVKALRQEEYRLEGMRRAAEQAIIEESKRLGRKTLRYELGSDGGQVVTAEISGGPGATGIDVEKLRAGLTKAGCPEERINEAITETIEYKANRSVCRQLAGANDAYKAAIDAATYTFEKRYSVRVG